MLTFRDFKDGPAGDLCDRVGMPLVNLPSWQSFASSFQMINKRSDGDLVDRLMRFPASSGEVGLIMAILHAADYSSCADEIGKNYTWHWLRSVRDEYAEAVAAAIIRSDAVGS